MKISTKYLANLLTRIFSLLLISSFFVTVANAQGTQFRARLSEFPVTPQTVRAITGVGEVFATLEGNKLTISGTFEGMSSAASAAHVHNAAKAMNGPPIGALTPTPLPSGEVTGELELTAPQIEAFNNEELYIVIHSENNPGGELRGWLLPRKQQ